MTKSEIIEILGLLFGWPFVVLMVGLLFVRDLSRISAALIVGLMLPKIYIAEKWLTGGGRWLFYFVPSSAPLAPRPH